MKGTRQGVPAKGDGKPTEGSKLRAMYDALRTGGVVSMREIAGGSNMASAYRRQLTDFYGMDIVPVKSDTGHNIGSRLVGEWDGPYYVPIERIVQDA